MRLNTFGAHRSRIGIRRPVAVFLATWYAIAGTLLCALPIEATVPSSDHSTCATRQCGCDLAAQREGRCCCHGAHHGSHDGASHSSHHPIGRYFAAMQCAGSHNLPPGTLVHRLDPHLPIVAVALMPIDRDPWREHAPRVIAHCFADPPDKVPIATPS